MPTTEQITAIGMIFLGFRDSSPYMALDSKPTHDQNAKNRPTPADPATVIMLPSTPATSPERLWKPLSGLSDPSDQPCGPPPVNTTDSAIMASMMISVIRKTPSTLAARLMSK